MGTWDIGPFDVGQLGPFDNDTAADFALALDGAEPTEREALVRGVLTRTVSTCDDLVFVVEAQKAAAAAALIAAQCPGGHPVDPCYAPTTPMPTFPDDLRLLAAEALARIVSDPFDSAGFWVAPSDFRRLIAMLNALRAVLDPAPPSMDVPMFDLDGGV